MKSALCIGVLGVALIGLARGEAVSPMEVNDPFCGEASGKEAVAAESNRKMAAKLKGIYDQANPMDSAFLSEKLVGLYEGLLSRAPDVNSRMNAKLNLALHLLNSGLSERSFETFSEIKGELEAGTAKGDPKTVYSVMLYRGLAALRMGEQANCITNHTTDSCLMPIKPKGFHVDTRGSELALEAFEEIMKRHGADLRTRWLYNVAAMTLGRYPHRVPSDWLIGPNAFASDYDISRFTDVAGSVGLDMDALAGGVVVEDFTGDGYLDVVATSWSLLEQARYYVNNGDGTFVERTVEAGLKGQTGSLYANQTDYNNDGRPDLYLARGAWLGKAGRHPNSLLRNNPDGTFTDVTEEAGMMTLHPTQSAVWLDYNNDGWVDLFVGNESTAGEEHACELFRNNQDGTFTDVAREAGVDVKRFVKGVAHGDYDNDGRMDLFISVRDGKNVLLRNLGAGAGGVWHFEETTAKAGVEEPLYSFPTWFFDYDNDGWLDLYVGGYGINSVADVAADYLRMRSGGATARLYRNKRDGTFEDVSEAMGVRKVLHGMSAQYGDLDNDGWLDFYLGTGDPELSTIIPNRMFRNAEGLKFQDVTTSGGFGHLQKGHSISFADLDNDGDQDVYAVMGGAYSGDNYRNVLFENPGHGNNWITVKLEGRSSNRAALGARVKATLKEGEGTREIHRTVSHGTSFGDLPLRQEMGIGKADVVESLEVFWPATGRRQTFKHLAANSHYRIVEDNPVVEKQRLKTFKLGSPGGFARRPDHTHARPVVN